MVPIVGVERIWARPDGRMFGRADRVRNERARLAG
ncbi:Uncharacterised protein [Streptomyces griseus]|uniref:Uncharacterized protein n=1 Tax=Streptomyces griseus TaxID=1911 RepID=A0A380NZC8_STRGR|nr:Uncharacterised protein [Streptomyces griseus]